VVTIRIRHVWFDSWERIVIYTTFMANPQAKSEVAINIVLGI